MTANGICVLGLAYSGCNIYAAVTFFTLSLALHGAVSTGPLASIVDIGPNYAGISLGIISTVSIITGFVSPIIVGHITFENQSITAWQRIFEICAVMLIVCSLIYIWFNDTSIQPWNNVESSSIYPKELAPLFGEKIVNELKENEMEKQEKNHEEWSKDVEKSEKYEKPR
jgi:nitrate/nitrite transporter NarK